MNELDNLKDKFNQINWADDFSIINFINNNNSDLLTGKNENGENIVFEIVKGDYIKISTHQKNGFIRINIYTIDKDESVFIIREEIFEK